jgi:hypothetical protein
MCGWHSCDVIRHHPVLSAVTAVYSIGLGVTLLRPSAYGEGRDLAVTTVTRALGGVGAAASVRPLVEFALDAIMFVPLGAVLVIIMGRAKWFSALFLVLVGSSWIAVAQLMMSPTDAAGPGFVAAAVTGAAVGVAVATAVGIVGRRRRNAGQGGKKSLTPLSQSPGSGL